LLVDLRPAYRKPLADVTPQFRAVSKGHTFTPQRWASALRADARLKVYGPCDDAVIRVYDDAGKVIETHQHAGGFKEW